jgi:hypothetical protein
MPLPISLPYTFASATTAIPLSNLDSDLVTLRDGINGIGNGTNALSNATINGFTGNTAVINVGSGQFYKDSSGNVGVGTSSPSSYAGSFDKVLTVFNTDQNLTIGARYQAGVGQLGFVNSGTANNSNPIPLAFMTGGIERMRVNETGNVGIGTSSPGTKLDAYTSGTTSTVLRTRNDTTTVYLDANNGYSYLNTFSNHPMLFGTNNTEQARITSNGQFLVNQTSGNNGRLSVFTSTTGDNLIEARSTASSLTHLLVNTTLSSAGGSDALGVYDASGISARITTNGFYESRPNSYGSTSDERLKENIVDATPKLADIMQVRVRNYNYKDQPGDKQLGVIAQELETVFPGLVHEIPNANPELASTETVKSVKYSVFVPMLIKAIQELKTELDALKGAK